VRALDQPGAKATPASQPLLDALHPAAIPFVIVSEKVEQAVQREHFQLGQ
jgi:hypothetical protein